MADSGYTTTFHPKVGGITVCWSEDDIGVKMMLSNYPKKQFCKDGETKEECEKSHSMTK